MKLLGLIGVIMLATACNNTAPTATAYKQQLGGTGAAVGNGNVNGGAGDATSGQTLFTGNGCAGCHAAGASNAFKAAVACDATALAKSPVHNSFADKFSGKNGLDITAYIKTLFPGAGGANAAGDPVAGEAALKAGGCEGCHLPAGGGVGPALDEFANFAGQESRAEHASAAATFTTKATVDNIIAALKARAK